jgi:undecaprenyl-diphosphatase
MEFVQATDEGTLFWCENHHTTVGNALMRFITRLGDPSALITVVALSGILFLVTGRRRTAVILLLVSLSGLGLTQLVSYLVKRERPDMAWRLIDRPHSPSFPSGHALNSMAIFGTLALLAARSTRRRIVCALVLVVGFLLPLTIGLSRPYLGVHYPSDVLAGWTAGLACALFALWADQRWGDRELCAPSLSPPPSVQRLPASTGGSEDIRPAREVTGVRRPD